MLSGGDSFDIAQLKLILYILQMKAGLSPEFHFFVGHGVFKDVIEWLKKTIEELERRNETNKAVERARERPTRRKKNAKT